MGPRGFLTILATLALSAPAARAQDQRALERRLDAAVEQRLKARAALVEYRRKAEANEYSDTIAISHGALRIVTRPDLLPLVRAAAAIADSFIQERVGSADTLLRGGPVMMVSADSVARRWGTVHTSFAMVSAVRDPLANADSLARVIEEHAQWSVFIRGGPSLVPWLDGQLPIDSTTVDQWRGVRFELASSAASVAHRCYSGDIGACKITLGLETEKDPVTAWYDAPTRRALVRDAAARLDRSEVDRCLAGDDAQCVALLRGGRMASVTSAPGSRQARSTLVQQALAAGGRGAAQRLFARKDSPGDALSAAAKLPIDSLVARWQRQVHSAGAKSEAFTPSIAVIALGWILAMGALSLRSSRWR